MKPRILFLFYYFCFWLGYFILFRGIFLLYHFDRSAALSQDLIFGIFEHGLRMDLSFTSYLSLVIFFLVALSTLLPTRLVSGMVKWYTLPVLAFLSFICVADLELFTEWGFRLDATPLTYISTPREMAVSASSSPFVLLISSIVIITVVSYWFYRKRIHHLIHDFPKVHLAHGVLFLLLTAGLIIPIRGGLQLAPLNQSVAFFSKNDYANQAALNVPWNVFRSITKQAYSVKNPYLSAEATEAQNQVKKFYKKHTTGTPVLLKSSRPNIILVLWESLTSKASPILGGSYENVLPELEGLLKEGILFENLYASGDRSDKGIVSVLSGYPAQPKRSIVKIPNKSSQLPMVTHSFNDQGYHTSFYHGGELEFANIKTYLLHGDFDTVLGKGAFNKNDMNSKWGAHDHVVFDKVLEDMQNPHEPFFNMIFTLSSHEPFEIPIESKFPGEDLESMYLSSLYYTDQSLGNFIRKAKQQPWYDNTLVIVLADHGHRLLNHQGRFQKEKYHVPMVWFGGALAVRDTVISKHCSQTDLATTLLNQLDMDHTSYAWSRDILNPQSSDGSFYVFNEGIALIDSTGSTIYDHQSGHLLDSSAWAFVEKKALCKAHLQAAYADFLNK